MNKDKISIEEIEAAVERGEEVVDKYFNPHTTRVGRPIKSLERRKKKNEIIKTNLDLTVSMAKELDDMSESLNISRQALIKVILRQALDTHYLATKSQESSEKAS